MIDYAYKDLFNQDSVNKQYIIEYDGGRITNKDLYQESVEIKESLCSENELKFGSCEASSITFKVANIVSSLKGKTITVSMYIGGHSEEPLTIGKYKVYSDTPSGDRNYRNITAYDSMYDIINADVTDWYSDLEFPLTVKQLRDSFFAYVGVEQEEVELICDDEIVEDMIDSETVSGKMIISSICEINGCFGHISRNGLFKHVFLPQGVTGLYPSDDLFPDDALFPVEDGSENAAVYTRKLYMDCEYEDFLSLSITKLRFLTNGSNAGVDIGDGTNIYAIRDNFILNSQDADSLARIGEKLFGKLAGIFYRPFKLSAKGNPCYEVGDIIKIITRKQIVFSYCLERTLSGIQSLKDSTTAKGTQYHTSDTNSISNKISNLNRKTDKLTIEIQETNEGLNTKVSKGDVSTEISQESEQITIRGNRLIVDTDHWDLDADGTQRILDDEGNTIVEIGQHGIVLSNGANLISAEGVAGDLTFTSGGVPMDIGIDGNIMTLGYFIVRDVAIQAYIPSNYVITSATVILITLATYWESVSDNYQTFVSRYGYPRSIKCYVGGGQMYKQATWDGEYEYKISATGNQIVSGDFTSGGVNGTSSITTPKVITSGDISNYLQTGNNTIRFIPAAYSGESNIAAAERTGTAVAILNVKGYTQN